MDHHLFFLIICFFHVTVRTDAVSLRAFNSVNLSTRSPTAIKIKDSNELLPFTEHSVHTCKPSGQTNVCDVRLYVSKTLQEITIIL